MGIFTSEQETCEICGKLIDVDGRFKTEPHKCEPKTVIKIRCRNCEFVPDIKLTSDVRIEQIKELFFPVSMNFCSRCNHYSAFDFISVYQEGWI